MIKPINEVPLLSIQHVDKSFKNKQVLKDVSIDIKKGEIFGILGTNGSGKTTLLNILIGFYKPQKGVILLNGQPYSQYHDIKKYFGMATQDCSFHPTLTVLDNVLYFSMLHNPKGPKKLYKKNSLATLQLLNLYDQRNEQASKLSGGMQRRVDIACGMAHSPSILLLDEPTSNLDPFLRKEIIKLIKSLNAVGVTMIIASHFLSELEEICNRVAIIDKGVVVAVGSPSEILKKSTTKSQLKLRTVSHNYNFIVAQLRKIVYPDTEFKLLGDTLVISGSDIETVHRGVIEILSKMHESVISLEVKRASLEDVFENIVGEKRHEKK